MLVFNPGSNSLKAGIVRCRPAQETAEVICKGIGSEPKLSMYRGKKLASTEPMAAGNFGEAGASILEWFAERKDAPEPLLKGIECVCIRVVHGRVRHTQPCEDHEGSGARDSELSKWAPLHNRRAVEPMSVAERWKREIRNILARPDRVEFDAFKTEQAACFKVIASRRA